jgi:hypothetical protein
MLHCQKLHLKNFLFQEYKIANFLPVRGVIIIHETYSTVLRNGNSLGKRGLAIFQEELLQKIFISL